MSSAWEQGAERRVGLKGSWQSSRTRAPRIWGGSNDKKYFKRKECGQQWGLVTIIRLVGDPAKSYTTSFPFPLTQAALSHKQICQTVPIWAISWFQIPIIFFLSLSLLGKTRYVWRQASLCNHSVRRFCSLPSILLTNEKRKNWWLTYEGSSDNGLSSISHAWSIELGKTSDSSFWGITGITGPCIKLFSASLRKY